jgi:hypothetical protein
MGARNRVGIGLSYWPARLHRLAEFIPWNRFLGSINVYKYGLRTSPGLHVHAPREDVCRAAAAGRCNSLAAIIGTTSLSFAIIL